MLGLDCEISIVYNATRAATTSLALNYLDIILLAVIVLLALLLLITLIELVRVKMSGKYSGRYMPASVEQKAGSLSTLSGPLQLVGISGLTSDHVFV